MAGVLNGSPTTFTLYDKFLKIPENKEILSKNQALECGVYLVMKANKENYKKKANIDDTQTMNVSTMQIAMDQQPAQLNRSQLVIKKASNNKI